MYEIFSGHRAFDGQTPADVLSAILTTDPPELPSTVPAGVRQIVSDAWKRIRRCGFNPLKIWLLRCGAVAGSKASSEGSTDSGSAVPPTATGTRFSKSYIAWLLAGAASVLALVLGFWRLAAELPRVDTSSFRFRPFATEEYPEYAPVWSPDGKFIAYVARPNTEYQLTVKGVDADRPLSSSMKLLLAAGYAYSRSLRRIQDP